eukprot:2384324-Prymnesium_polylepis.1
MTPNGGPPAETWNCWPGDTCERSEAWGRASQGEDRLTGKSGFRVVVKSVDHIARAARTSNGVRRRRVAAAGARRP